jgi:hypothetical protein
LGTELSRPRACMRHAESSSPVWILCCRDCRIGFWRKQILCGHCRTDPLLYI